MNNDFNKKLELYVEEFERYASEFFSRKFKTEPRLLQSVKYSFFAGGKRIRPCLMFASADYYGVSHKEILPFALALECIHTYSLIHDDLPAMDNDDYRRGKFTNHKVYGEAIAVLAGDALLNLAFSIIAHECLSHTQQKVAECAALLADYAGFEGMVGGQAYDVESERAKCKDKDVLTYIEENKTGKLITAALVIPCIFAEQSPDFMLELGKLLGVQFQIVDDILDVESSLAVLGKSIGKDQSSGKLTYVNLYGLDKAKKRSEELHNGCIELLEKNSGTEFLFELCNMLYERIR